MSEKKFTLGICGDCQKPFAYRRGHRGPPRKRCDPCLLIEKKAHEHDWYIYKRKPQRLAARRRRPYAGFDRGQKWDDSAFAD